VTSSTNGAYKEETFTVSETTTVTVTFNNRVQVTVRYSDTNDLVDGALVIVTPEGWSGITGSDGRVIFGYGVMNPTTDHRATASKGGRNDIKDFATNSDGGAEVTMYI
jgi:hypothetical protein